MNENNKTLSLEKASIEHCESIIIKDPWYDRGVWCAFQVDNCSAFSHAKALVTNYDDYYKDDEFEFDFNNTEFAMVLGTEDFVSCIDPRISENGKIAVYSRLNNNLYQATATEIGCDTAEFSFGNERTFGAFAIHTGADGSIGEVHLYTVKGSNVPVGCLFIGSVDGEMVPPEEIMDSFKAAFGIDREKDRSLQSRINKAEKKKEDVPEKTGFDRENMKN